MLRRFGVSEGRRICHKPLCLPDNNRTQYFIKIKCSEHARRFTGLIKDGVADAGGRGEEAPAPLVSKLATAVTDRDQATVRERPGGQEACP